MGFEFCENFQQLKKIRTDDSNGRWQLSDDNDDREENDEEG